mgnify:CR=1 FL=1
MDDNNTFDAEEFKKPKLKSILINLLITLAVAAVAFYVTLPAINTDASKHEKELISRTVQEMFEEADMWLTEE